MKKSAKNNSVYELLQQTTQKLKPISFDLAQREAERIITYVMKKERNWLYINATHRPDLNVIFEIQKITNLRLSGEPLAYAIGSSYFYNREFAVEKSVLIPRPDTETLIETVLENETSKKLYFLELGCGSGIIPAVLSSEREKWNFISTDISFPALKIATKNIANSKNNLACCNRFEAIKPQNNFDFIVSNPPYITDEEMLELEESVKKYEPNNALKGGPDGLEFYKYLAQKGRFYLKKRGRIYLEVGHKQSSAVSKILRENNWENIKTTRDLAQRDRVVYATVN